MKRISTIILIPVLILVLTGCNNQINKAKEEASSAVNGAKDTLNETKEDLENAVNKLEETVEDTKEASRQIKEAKDSIDAITE